MIGKENVAFNQKYFLRKKLPLVFSELDCFLIFISKIKIKISKMGAKFKI